MVGTRASTRLRAATTKEELNAPIPNMPDEDHEDREEGEEEEGVEEKEEVKISYPNLQWQPHDNSINRLGVVGVCQLLVGNVTSSKLQMPKVRLSNWKSMSISVFLGMKNLNSFSVQGVKRMVRSQNQKCPATWWDLLRGLFFALSLSLLSSELWNKAKTKTKTNYLVGFAKRVVLCTILVFAFK